MSRVFLAEEVRLGRQVVVKVLPPEMGAGVNLERFEREIQLAARLQHPHIVALLTTGASGDLIYYIMPYIAGESLRVKLTREAELPVGETVRILREVMDALAYAHRNGVVHRDIKPDNVLISERHAVVTDFGVAKAVSASSGGASSLTSLGVALGTPAYMSPEQAAADPHVDHRADIYAVGVLAYEMLTGRTPFIAPTPQAQLAAQITQAPEPVLRHRSSVPDALNALIMRCLEKRPADRWQTAEEMVAQLEAMSTPSGGMAPSGAVAPVSSGTEAAIRRSHPARVAGLFVIASIGVLGVVYALIHLLGLPDWVLAAAGLLLLLGLPIMLLTGHLERKRALARTTGHMQVVTPTGLPALFTWRKALMGGLLAFAALGVGTLVYTGMRLLGIGPVGTLMASGKLTAKDRLVVADFENRGADSTLGPSVSEAFRIDLGQTRVVSVLSTSQISDALARMQRDPNTPLTTALAREVAAREGAKAVVAGEISRVGQGFVLSARLITADGTELVALRETAEDDRAIVPAIDRLSGHLRERIGESLRTIRGGEPLEKVTTSSMEALRLYSEGAKLSDQGEFAKATVALRQAIALDSGFAMAWRKLAVVLGNTQASNDQETAATIKAYEHRDRLPEIERQVTTAYYYNIVDYKPEELEAAYRRILAIDPTNDIASNNLSLFLAQRGRFVEAESLAVGMIRQDPSTGNQYFQLLNAQIGQGHFDAARATLEQLGRAGPTSPTYLQGKAWLLSASRSFDSAQRAWLDLGMQVRDPSYQSVMHFALTGVAQTRGQLAEAERQTRLGEEVDQQRGLPGAVLTREAAVAKEQALFQGDSLGALKVLKTALEQHPLAGIPALDRPLPQLAIAYTVAGQPALARKLLTEYESSVPIGRRRGLAAWYRATGWLALSEGRPKDAVTAFQAAQEWGECSDCGNWELGLAYERASLPDSAVAAYERAAAPQGTGLKTGEARWSLAPSLRRLGELYDARGDKAKALEYYGQFADLWKEADPSLQPVVREVKTRMAALAGESH
jgi:eukaryotic-like serine/threonine-protein kinase